jgi:hypothetical protein
MVEKLENGKIYKWIGKKERPGSFNDSGQMDEILDGKPRKFIKINSDQSFGYFEGCNSNSLNGWSWSLHFYKFEEVKENLLTIKENFKVWIGNFDLAEKVQKHLFDLGFSFHHGIGSFESYALFSKNKKLSGLWDNDYNFFRNHDFLEITVSDILSWKILELNHEFKKGEIVLVSEDNENWCLRIFIIKVENTYSCVSECWINQFMNNKLYKTSCWKYIKPYKFDDNLK